MRDPTDGLLADWGRRSWVGDSLKHSSSDIEVVDSLLNPAPNRKGGNWLSALRGPMLPVENPLVRASEGLIKIDFRRLRNVLVHIPHETVTATYSTPCIGRGASRGSGRGGDDCKRESSGVVDFGLGEGTSTCTKCGCLCGRGEMSIRSFSGPGDDDGRGGVVTLSVFHISISSTPPVCFPCLPRPSIVPKRFEVKSDRRGVGNCGLQAE